MASGPGQDSRLTGIGGNTLTRPATGLILGKQNYPMKKAALIFLLTLTAAVAFAQLGSNRASIIAKYGTDYETGITDDGEATYLTYKEWHTTAASGGYDKWTCYYFQDDECVLVRILEPMTEFNAWIMHMDARYVRIDYWKWLDYANGFKFSLERGETILTLEIRSTLKVD